MATTAGTRSLDDELIAHGFTDDPYPAYARLREEDPVHWVEPWQQWVVSRHADVLRILRDPMGFSSAGWEAGFLRRFPTAVYERLPAIRAHFDTQFLSISDPPEHTRLRRPIVKALTPRVVETLRPRIEEIVDGLLDKVDATGGQIDYVRDFAYPLPATVIADILGIPAEDREQFMGWSADVMDFLSTGDPSLERAERAQVSMASMRDYARQLIADRREHPDEALVSLLIAAIGLDEPFSEEELVVTTIALITAGHETTANLLSSGLLALLRHPDQLDRLRADPELTPTAVEEFLRFDAPLQRFRRVVVDDVEVGGRQLRAGQFVMAFGGSANHDPAVFSDPDVVDVGRDPNPHLTFGQGIHFCVGAGVSRLEAKIVFDRLLRRYRDIRLAPDATVRWRANIAFRGLATLPVELECR